jgi:hypothetical protein
MNRIDYGSLGFTLYTARVTVEGSGFGGVMTLPNPGVHHTLQCTQRGAGIPKEPRLLRNSVDQFFIITNFFSRGSEGLSEK